MNQEKFKLTWHTYTDHLREMLHDMKDSNELTDVTLVSEDKKQFKAHKVVLSASSPVFKSIISDYSLALPIIYLRGIQSYEIESILQFIYLGQATFYKDRMNEFLSVAKSLEIKEIKKESPENEEFATTEFEMKIESPEYNSQPDQIKEDNVFKQGQIQSYSKGKKSLLYYCDQCDKQYVDQFGLTRHKKSAHEGVKYPCNQCSFKTGVNSALQRHVKAIHDGVKYPCDQCNNIFSQKHHLKSHIKLIHGEVNYYINES